MKGRSGFSLSDWMDWIFPRLIGSEAQWLVKEEEKAKEESETLASTVEELPSKTEELESYLADVVKLQEDEQSRKQSVDARLTSIIGLMSIAATVVLSGLLAMATGTILLTSLAARSILVLGLLYLSLQLCVALFEAVKGLSRQSATAETGVNLFPTSSEKKSHFLKSRIRKKLSYLSESRISTNAKLGRMAVAQIALRNFLAGLLALAVAAAVIAILRDPPRASGLCTADSDSQCSVPRNESESVKIELVGAKLDKLVDRFEASLTVHQGGSQTRINLAHLATIGPFPSGGHQLDGSLLADCLRATQNAVAGSSIVGWQVVGRVDKRELRRERALIYGSNQGLAMTRAVWVRDHLLSKQEGFDPASVVLSVGGASNIGGKVGDGDLASDRAVDVYVFLQRSEAKSASNTYLLPVSVACP